MYQGYDHSLSAVGQPHYLYIVLPFTTEIKLCTRSTVRLVVLNGIRYIYLRGHENVCHPCGDLIGGWEVVGTLVSQQIIPGFYHHHPSSIQDDSSRTEVNTYSTTTSRHIQSHREKNKPNDTHLIIHGADEHLKPFHHIIPSSCWLYMYEKKIAVNKVTSLEILKGTCCESSVPVCQHTFKFTTIEFRQRSVKAEH